MDYKPQLSKLGNYFGVGGEFWVGSFVLNPRPAGTPLKGGRLPDERMAELSSRIPNLFALHLNI